MMLSTCCYSACFEGSYLAAVSRTKIYPISWLAWTPLDGARSNHCEYAPELDIYILLATWLHSFRKNKFVSKTSSVLGNGLGNRVDFDTEPIISFWGWCGTCVSK